MKRKAKKAVQTAIGRRGARMVRGAVMSVWFIALALTAQTADRTPSSAEPSEWEPNYILHTWTKRDGLPQNTIYCISRDAKGNLLLGAESGALRFDGLNFRKLESVYPINESFFNIRVTALLSSRDRDTWIGSYGRGLAVLRNQRRDFHVYSTLNGFPGDFIQCLAEDSSQNIWVGTIGAGAVCIGPKTMTSWTTRVGLSHNTITAILPMENGGVWIGSEKGLNLLINKRILIFSNREGLPGNRITALFKDRWSGIWAGTSNGVRRIISDQNPPPAQPRFYFQSFPELDGQMISAIVQDIHGVVWIATSRGLFQAAPFNRYETPQLRPFKTDVAFFRADLLSLYLDREGIVWAGGAGSGLGSLIREKSKAFTTRQGLSHDHITSVFQDRDGDIWLGTAGGGLNRIHNGSVRVYTSRDGLRGNFIRSVCQAGDGSLWIGSQDGLNLLKNNRITSFSSRDGLSEDCINVLYPDSRGDLWIGTHGGGLNRFRNGRFEVLSTADGLSSNYVTALTGDIYGAIWAGTISGLNRVSEGYLEYFTGKTQLSGVTVTDLYLDSRSRLWIATLGGGLYHYYRDWLTHFPKPKELATGSFYRILENSAANQLWLSSDRGILVAARDTLESFSMGFDEAAPFYYINEGDLNTASFSGGFQPAGWVMKDGAMWFPTSSGAVILTPNRQTSRNRAPMLQIERLLADDIPYDVNRLSQTPRVNRRIEIEFGTAEFNAPGTIRYMYKLTGSRSMLFTPPIYDREWREPPLGNRLVFKDLPSGFYYVEIIAAAPVGAVNYDDVTTVSFIVNDRFYESFPFQALVLIAGLALFFLVSRRLRRHSRSGEHFTLFDDAGKYKTFNVPLKKARKYRALVLAFMDAEKPWMDPEITMPKLAELMNMSKEELSYVVNKELRLNFNAFINEYRIREAKERLKDPRENQFVILKIAHDVGFNSKSTFNLVFKNLTGMSPSEYRRKHQPAPKQPANEENE